MSVCPAGAGVAGRRRHWPPWARRALTLCAAATTTAAAALAGAPSVAWAHLMPAHEATLTVRDRQAFVALSLPATGFAAADDDRDGRLTVAEVERHQELLQRLVATRVHVRDGRGDGRVIFARVSVERPDPAGPYVPVPDVLVLVVAAFDEAPATLTLAIDGLAPGDDGRLHVRAARAGQTEVARLDGDRPSHAFFASAWQRVVEGATLGVQHIVHGPDHLAFLLALVLVGAGWAYWSAVVSSFTGAHAVVLLAAAAGWTPPVPPALTEVLIAATIIAAAARVAIRSRSARPRVGREAALAALCGLVHGMGVAESVRALDADGRPDLLALAGFNAGVEVAQLGAVALAVGALAGVTAFAARAGGAAPPGARHAAHAAAARAPRIIAGGLGVAGLGWMAERLPTLW